MGIYVDQAYIEARVGADRLVQLTRDDGGETVDTDVLEELIQDAESEFDAYAAKRYELPLASVPAFVRPLVGTLVVSALYNRRPRPKVPESVEKDLEAATAKLKLIASGLLSLGVSTSPAQASERAAIVDVATRNFSRATLKGF